MNARSFGKMIIELSIGLIVHIALNVGSVIMLAIVMLG